MAATTATARSTQAWAIECARERIGMEREELAERLTAATHTTWTKVMVRNLEIGQKRIDAELIPLLCEILDAPAWFLLGGFEGPDALQRRRGDRQISIDDEEEKSRYPFPVLDPSSSAAA